MELSSLNTMLQILFSVSMGGIGIEHKSCLVVSCLSDWCIGVAPTFSQSPELEHSYVEVRPASGISIIMFTLYFSMQKSCTNPGSSARAQSKSKCVRLWTWTDSRTPKPMFSSTPFFPLRPSNLDSGNLACPDAFLVQVEVIILSICTMGVSWSLQVVGFCWRKEPLNSSPSLGCIWLVQSNGFLLSLPKSLLVISFFPGCPSFHPL